MDALAVVLFSIVLFAHSWTLLGRSDLKLTGIIGGTVAFILILLLALQPLNLMTGASPIAIALCLVLFIVYAVSLAGIGLGGFDPRVLGFYSAFHAFGRLLLVLSFLRLGGLLGLSAAIVQIILTILFVLLAFHLIVNTRPL